MSILEAGHDPGNPLHRQHLNCAARYLFDPDPSADKFYCVTVTISKHFMFVFPFITSLMCFSLLFQIQEVLEHWNPEGSAVGK
jgi:hypothetical protein